LIFRDFIENSPGDIALEKILIFIGKRLLAEEKAQRFSGNCPGSTKMKKRGRSL
jgi:hypothetical protein